MGINRLISLLRLPGSTDINVHCSGMPYLVLKASGSLVRLAVFSMTGCPTNVQRSPYFSYEYAKNLIKEHIPAEFLCDFYK